MEGRPASITSSRSRFLVYTFSSVAPKRPISSVDEKATIGERSARTSPCDASKEFVACRRETSAEKAEHRGEVARFPDAVDMQEWPGQQHVPDP